MSAWQHIQQICQFRQWRLGTDTAGNYVVDVTVEGNPYKVTIMRQMDHGRMVTLLLICDICPECDIKDPVDLLKDNGRMNHGAFAIIGQRLVVLDTQIEQTADIEEIAAIILHLATYADRFNKKLQWKGYGDGPQLGKMLGGPRKGPG